MDLLRQYLIAPYEAGPRRLLHQQRSVSHHHITKANLEQQSQQQSQQRSHQQSQQQSHQQSQQHQQQPQQRSQQQPQPQEPIPSRDQVLKGLALYPDILFSILGMRESTFLQSLQSPVSGFPPAGFEAYSSTQGCYSYTPLGSNQRREVGRVGRDRKTADKVKETSKTSKTSIPTSPKAGRYAKGQRLQRGQHGSLPLKRKSSIQGTETTDLGRLDKRARQEEPNHEGQRGARDSMQSSSYSSSGKVTELENDKKKYGDEAINSTKSTTTTASTTNLTNSTKSTTAKPITLINRTIPTTPTKPTKRTAIKTQQTLLATAKPLDVVPYSATLPTHAGVKASSHNKIHSTCFLWYHGMCPYDKTKGGKEGKAGKTGKGGKGRKKCRFLHALTEPISFVQPPEGFVHLARRQKSGDGDGEDGKDAEERGDASGDEQVEQANQEVTCTLDWCPGDWLWDHSHSDNDKQDDEEISNEQGDKNFGLED